MYSTENLSSSLGKIEDAVSVGLVVGPGKVDATHSLAGIMHSIHTRLEMCWYEN